VGYTVEDFEADQALRVCRGVPTHMTAEGAGYEVVGAVLRLEVLPLMDVPPGHLGDRCNL